MTLKARIEQVLKTHLYPAAIFPLPGQPSGFPAMLDFDRLTADLLAACQPDREALRILVATNVDAIERTHTFNGFLDALMAWATGTDELRWCEHMAWNGSRFTRTGWPNSASEWTTDMPNWTFCPICGAPRPEAG